MSIRSVFAAVIFLALPTVAWAQTGTVQGTVVEAGNLQPLTAVQVMAPAEALQALTNPQGAFVLELPAGDHLIRARRLGYLASEQIVEVVTGATVTADFALQPSAVALEGIVVTALGIQREARAVAVAAQQLSDAQLTRAEPNFVNTLAGRVSGVQITNAGPQGGSSRIVIRGASSITGTNQPLFVVDGVPVDNYSPTLVGVGGMDYGNAVQDLNPEDIESVTVLKGPNAAALYGSRAANGAILVTTKTGAASFGGQITASQVVTFESPLRLPTYQNQYGQGLQGRFEFVDGDGLGVFDFYDESWGPPMDGRLVPQYHSPWNPETQSREPLPWVPQPDNIRNFFERGVTSTTNASFAWGSDESSLRLSLSRRGVDGMIPGHELERITLGLAGGLQATDRLRAETSVQFVRSEGNQRPGIGYGADNPMTQFVWWGRQIDIRDLRDRYLERRPEGDPQEGMPYAWNYRYFPNPYYLQLVNTNTDTRNRVIGQVSVSYQVLPWLNAMIRTGTDLYQDDRRFNYAQDLWGMNGFDPRPGQGHANARPIGEHGAFGEWNIGFEETNTDLLVTVTPNLPAPFTFTTTVGANRRDAEREQRYAYVPDLTASGIYSITNARIPPDPLWDFVTRRRMNSLLGTAELGYDDHLFLTVTGRNDWSSTLPEDNRSYFYPSVSAAWVFSDVVHDALPLTRPIEFGKLRASWTRVGADTEPYRLRDTFLPQAAFQGFPTFQVGNTLANAELRPEITESWEFGTDLGFLQGRLGLDMTYYTATTRDQIFSVQVSRASGYSGMFVNAGSVRNRGVEALVSVIPLQAPSFRWETRVNFARNRNQVIELREGVEGLNLGGLWGVDVWAREGEPYGQLMGRTLLRNADGEVVVGESGLPALGPLDVIGNYVPDWRAGWLNTFTYGPFSLGVLLDRQQGGDIYSITHMFGRYAGVLEETLAGRCINPAWPAVEGMPTCNAETAIVYPGVKVSEVTAQGDSVFVPNDIPVDAQTFNRGLFGRHEMHVFDGTYTKLRELTLTYQVPDRFVQRARISAASLSLIGRNLWLRTDVPHIDPETAFDASNVQGLEFGQLPTPRSIGFHLTVRP